MTVREVMNQLGLSLFPQQWSGREYRNHWKLGQTSYSPEIQRGKHIAQELVRRIRAGEIRVELDESGAPPEFDVCSLYAPSSSCAGEGDAPLPCILRFRADVAPEALSPSKAGRKPADWPAIVVLILEEMDKLGVAKVAELSVDALAYFVIDHLDKDGLKVPHYSKVQPYAKALQDYWIAKNKKITEIDSGN